MRFQPELEDVDFAWNSRETHEARVEFLSTLPDDALNALVESGFWPHLPEKVELLSIVYAHPGLTMISALSHYADSPAMYIHASERDGLNHLQSPEVIDLLMGLREKLNNFVFVDAIQKYQHFSAPLKQLLKNNAQEQLGRFALDPGVIEYAQDVIRKDKEASEKTRYNIDGDVLTNQEMVKALIGAVEDPVPREQATKLGRAAIWLRQRVGL